MIVLLLASVLAASPPAETSSYHVTACLGSCPVYTVTASSDGRAIYNGERFVAVVGERSFRVTPSEFEAFRARLAPYRPKQGQEVLVRADSALCPEYGFDAPSIEITWSSDGRPDQRLDYYGGCLNPKVPPEMWGSLVRAIETLPVAGFVRPKNGR
jgi:Domain of unknown function (DUF6438)